MPDDIMQRLLFAIVFVFGLSDRNMHSSQSKLKFITSRVQHRSQLQLYVKHRVSFFQKTKVEN